jgi:drug/metabolite transporter (DMT)-like permease
VLLSLAGALAAAFCFGVASVLQAMAARSVPGGMDARVLVRVVGQWRYVLGLGLDLAGFVAELAALRGLPLFVVQAAVASALAVTALAAAVLLRARLAGREWLAVLGVCLGLALLGASAGEEGPAQARTAFRVGLLATALLLGVLGVAARRTAPPVLGVLAGLGFGVVAITARVLPSLAPADLVRDPGTYALAVAGLVGMLLYAAALRLGAVTVVTAALVLAETVAPALVGVAALGDRTRPGFAAVAVAGFVLALAGALGLARFGEPAEGPLHRDPLHQDPLHQDGAARDVQDDAADPGGAVRG